LYIQSYNQLYDELYNHLVIHGDSNIQGPIGSQGDIGVYTGYKIEVLEYPTYDILYLDLYDKLYSVLYNNIYNPMYNQLYNQLYDQLYNSLKSNNIKLKKSEGTIIQGIRGPTGPIGPIREYISSDTKNEKIIDFDSYN